MQLLIIRNNDMVVVAVETVWCVANVGSPIPKSFGA
jgi:hypothetical protein